MDYSTWSLHLILFSLSNMILDALWKSCSGHIVRLKILLSIIMSSLPHFQFNPHKIECIDQFFCELVFLVSNVVLYIFLSMDKSALDSKGQKNLNMAYNGKNAT